MLERKKLNKLVVMTLQHSGCQPKASELYDRLRCTRPNILREETVRSFKSFVKIINSFEQIELNGSGTKTYSVKKEFILGK